MAHVSELGVAVIGTGFIGGVHTWAIRRLGAQLRGVLGSSPERGAEGARAMGAPRAYGSLEEIIADPSVDIVHVTSPNHAHYAQVKALLEGGKHVVCEKPLSMTSAESAEMVEIARKAGKVAAVCYNIRFYPLNQHAHRMVADGGIGRTRFVTGHYHQDWLAKETDWNWRLLPEAGGALRAVGDIGTHWVDLTSFILGEKPAEVLAELTTFLPERRRPAGPVATFSAAAGETIPTHIETDDTAQILLRYPSGARGTVTISQVNIGRKNSLLWDIAGSDTSASWYSETPDHLFIGHRDAPNQILQRDFGLMNATGTAAASLPPGHVEGFADTFFALFRQVYGDVLAGGRQAGSTWATFEDGHFEMLFCEAVLESAKSSSWVKIG
ncbi:Gfo/Idh/MocA family protein [Histidinibacterium lentulum]|uniref:Gfo/Idh/MocA family oxidoreductase n=1 Tax=Histidinibacterium lentulum TaxID=2480588 RepID=A0A3N2R519_9RHOB|nr:Gfo/Idh/MocA family oxidoreductase [Histidinibacterium lentulum]ROU02590.1 gfo/Idh/MocA family oxidoreductase [Histidinibacterium lentulum]